ncbi:uncharacterized protein LOC128963958, partial [Oppia nitens]|uniref:uncharacterized protein LOC128963958 n=1 Tax=Oppia nitens TaxID=1686743 RepID=UPI0023DBC08D
MDLIIETLADINDIEDIRDLWEEVCDYCNSCQRKSSNLVIGIPKVGDTVLWHQILTKESNCFSKTKAWIQYPPKGSVNCQHNIITGIAVLDINNDGNGGNADIIDGGIGRNFARIKLRSKFRKGLSFQVIIIG